jgi:alkylation response protein AidB-like acyl-CoA dehydrogenase
MADDLERVDALIDDLLTTHDPKTTKIEEFRGAQYDRGLAWVHFPEESGGLGLSPTLQRHVDSRLRAAGAAPHGTLFFGLSLAGPTTHGSDELRPRAPADVHRRGDLVPAVLRAGRGLTRGLRRARS